MSRAALAALAVVAVVVTREGGLDVSAAIGALRLGITLNTASSLALVTLAGAAFLGQGSAARPSSGALALGAMAAMAPSPAQLVLAASLGAGARPAVVAALGAAAVVGGAPDRLLGLGAAHAVGVLLALVGLLTARGPLAPLMLLITASLGLPSLWTSGFGRVALISGGVGLAVVTALGATLDGSRVRPRLSWAWAGLGLAAMGAAEAPLGLALGLAGLSVAALTEPGVNEAARLPAWWGLGLVALAAGALPNVGLGGGRDPLLGLIASGDPVAAAGVLLVSAATGYSLGRAPQLLLSQALVGLAAAPVILGLARWLSPMLSTPRAELHLVGILAGALNLGAGLWALRGGRLPERQGPSLAFDRPWPLLLVAPSTPSADNITKALAVVGLALWALWTLSATLGLYDRSLHELGLESFWAR